MPVEVASPGRSAVVGADDDGGSELLGPSIGIGQPSGATAGTATAGVAFAGPRSAAPPWSRSFAAPPPVSAFAGSAFGWSAFSGAPTFGSSTFGS